MALALFSLPAAAVNQTGGGKIPFQTGKTCSSNATICINDNEVAEGGDGDIDAVATATISQETFNPLCELTFKVVARGASFANTFGWYPIERDARGAALAPQLSDLHVFLGCDDDVGTEKALSIPKDVGEIGFFLANNRSGCVATRDDPLGPTLTTQPANLFFSQREFNSDGDGLIHLLVWQGRANPNAFYFGWEDQSGGGDNDFEDLLTYVTGIQCTGGGEPCQTDGEGVCADGVVQCRDGALTCVPTQTASAEFCNGLDDDCNSEIDDGDGLCEPGLICVRGECQPPCGTGEFRCGSSEACVDGTCVDKACADKACAVGEVCRKGACLAACAGVACPYGATCRNGLCVDVCEGVECDPGFACEVRQSSDGETLVGVCSSCDCRGCPEDQTCIEHLCVANACKDQTCAEGTHCIAGECVDDCAEATCPSGQSCRAGRCVDDPEGSSNEPESEGSAGNDGGIIIEPDPSGGSASTSPEGTGDDDSYLEAKGCSCEAPGARRSAASWLVLAGLALAAGLRRRRQ